jgi:hypothetical protein
MTTEQLGSLVAEGVRSLEVRWIFPGQLETSVVGWFARSGPDVHSAEDLDWVAQELNDRPRKRPAFNKPIELIGDLLLR